MRHTSTPLATRAYKTPTTDGRDPHLHNYCLCYIIQFPSGNYPTQGVSFHTCLMASTTKAGRSICLSSYSRDGEPEDIRILVDSGSH